MKVGLKITCIYNFLDGTIYGIHDERRVDQDQFFFKQLTPNSELKTICEVEIDMTEDIQECLVSRMFSISNNCFSTDKVYGLRIACIT